MYGTAKEIAERQNIKRQTIFFYNTEAYKNRTYAKKNSLIVIRLDDEET